MKRLAFCYIVFSVLIPLLYGQEPTTKHYSYSGQVQVVFDSDTVAPYPALFFINEVFADLSDSSGYFSVKNLKNGDYSLSSKQSEFRLDTIISIRDSSVENVRLYLKLTDSINQVQAKRDILSGHKKLFFKKPNDRDSFLSSDDSIFEKKYATEYVYSSFKEEYLPLYDAAVNYNRKIFEYLDSKYGESWRDEVRKDVIGYFLITEVSPNLELEEFQLKHKELIEEFSNRLFSVSYLRDTLITADTTIVKLISLKTKLPLEEYVTMPFDKNNCGKILIEKHKYFDTKGRVVYIEHSTIEPYCYTADDILGYSSNITSHSRYKYLDEKSLIVEMHTFFGKCKTVKMINQYDDFGEKHNLSMSMVKLNEFWE